MQPSRLLFDPTLGINVVTLKAGKIGGEPGGGVIGRQDVGIAGRDSAVIEYAVRLPASFEWVKVGKMPGIYGGTVTDFTPSKPPNGINGFSARPLWRTDGRIDLYVWDMRPDPAIGGYGREYHSAMRWPTGRWVTVRLGVTLNTPGVADGVITLEVDGLEVLRVTDLMARSTDAMKLSGCFWCCFFGGGTRDYAPTRTQVVEITDVTA